MFLQNIGNTNLVFTNTSERNERPNAFRSHQHVRGHDSAAGMTCGLKHYVHSAYWIRAIFCDAHGSEHGDGRSSDRFR